GTPPRPLVRVERPGDGGGPLIFPLPGGGPVRFKVVNAAVSGTPIFRVYRTDLGPQPRAVARLRAGPGATSGFWDGTVTRHAGGPKPPPGVYVISAQVADRAGNVGSSFPFSPPRKG